MLVRIAHAMATCTTGAGMAANQRESGAIVIEGNRFPATGGVAG